MKGAYIIGIDEVGRGPLAGPVTVAAVAIPATYQAARLKGLKDSKKLTKHQREALRALLACDSRIAYAVASRSARFIDRYGIVAAANGAARTAYQKLMKRYPAMPVSNVYLDGGLYLGKRREQTEGGKPKHVHDMVKASANRYPGLKHEATTVVKGDEKIPAVSAASTFAKVMRDSHMEKLAHKYPGYGLDRHKGYGTPAHLKAIAAKGPTPIHRTTFIPPRIIKMK